MKFKNGQPLPKYKASIYLFLVPGFIFALIFSYLPMLGSMMAFQEFDLFAGDTTLQSFLKSPWVGLAHFKRLFADPLVWRAFRNTLVISFYKIAFLFPLPVFLAIMITEVKNIFYKRFVQTALYLPHFLSWVVVAALALQVFGPYGLINNLLKNAGAITQGIPFLGNENSFRLMLVLTAGWKETGWNAIIYIAAIAGISPQLYEAATIDGASKLQQVFKITIPSITSTIAMLFILRLGSVLDAGFDQVFNMYGPAVYQTGDIIGTYVYRLSTDADYSFGTAVGLFNSVAAFIIVVTGNFISRKSFDKGIW